MNRHGRYNVMPHRSPARLTSWKDKPMAVHFTLYLEEQPAEELRRLMAAYSCSATRAVELLLCLVTRAKASPAARALPDLELTHLAVA